MKVKDIRTKREDYAIVNVYQHYNNRNSTILLFVSGNFKLEEAKSMRTKNLGASVL